MKKILERFEKQHMDTGDQKPVIHAETSRLNTNLFAVPSQDIRNRVFVKCKNINGKAVALDKGALFGLGKGNILKTTEGSSTITVEVQQVLDSSAIAVVKSGDAAVLNIGQPFHVVDWYTESAPILKIYLPQSQYSQGECYNFYKKNIAPVLKYPKRAAFDQICSNLKYKFYLFAKSPYYEDLTRAQKVTMRNLNAGAIASIVHKEYFFLYLPIPKELIAALQQKVVKDQNIVFVDNPEKADATLYCSLSSRNDFVFTISNEINNRKYRHVHVPSKFRTEMTADTLPNYSMNKLASELYSKVLLTNASNRRLSNLYPKR
jgi:hypothetical protein